MAACTAPATARQTAATSAQPLTELAGILRLLCSASFGHNHRTCGGGSPSIEQHRQHRLQCCLMHRCCHAAASANSQAGFHALLRWHGVHLPHMLAHTPSSGYCVSKLFHSVVTAWDRGMYRPLKLHPTPALRLFNQHLSEHGARTASSQVRPPFSPPQRGQSARQHLLSRGCFLPSRLDFTLSQASVFESAAEGIASCASFLSDVTLWS